MATQLPDTDKLIERLAREVRPVHRLLDPRRRAALWCAGAVVCVTLGVIWFGARRDLAQTPWNAGLVTRLVLLVATVWLSIATALRLAVPGADPRVWRRWWPLAALGALIAVSAAELAIVAVVGEVGSPLRSWTCVRKLAFVGAAPAVASIVLIHRAAAVEPVWAALLGVLAAGAAGALTAELACPIRLPMHIMLWHIAPVALSAALGALVGSMLWRSVRRR